MFCANCGKEIPDGSTFCIECGTKIEPAGESGKAGNKKKTPIIPIIIVFIIFAAGAAAAFMFIQKSKAKQDAIEKKVQERLAENESDTSETKESAESTGTTGTETKESDTITETPDSKEDEFKIEDIDITDYENAVSPADYSYYHSGITDFGFGYPTKIYKSVSVDDSEATLAYGTNIKTVAFEGSEGSRLIYSLTKRNDTLSIENMKDKVYYTELSPMFDAYDIVNSSKDDYGKVIVTGYEDEDRSVAVYCLSRIEGEYVLQMKIIFPDYTDDEDKYHKDYMSECLYRMCAFSDAKDGVRSYEDYVDAKREAVNNMSAEDTETERLRIRDLIADGKAEYVKKEYGSGGIEYEQEYYFENGCLVFAYYYGSKEGNSNHRFYFKDGFMFRWCDGESPNQTVYDISDNDMQGEWYLFEKEVKEAAKAVRRK